MAYGRDRLRAVPTPALGTADVIFSTADAKEIYRYFIARMDPAMVLRRMSDWKLGEPIAADIRGDRVTLEALRTLPNSSRNRAFDAEGAPIRDAVILTSPFPAERRARLRCGRAAIWRSWSFLTSRWTP